MPVQWTGEIIGKMHLNKIAKKQLAESLGVTPEYVSMVLNGHKEPKGAKERFTDAVQSLVDKQQEVNY